MSDDQVSSPHGIGADSRKSKSERLREIARTQVKSVEDAEFLIKIADAIASWERFGAPIPHARCRLRMLANHLRIASKEASTIQNQVPGNSDAYRWVAGWGAGLKFALSLATLEEERP